MDKKPETATRAKPPKGPVVELKQVVGKFYDQASGKVRRVAWDMDMVLLNGKQVATINRVPGSPIGLLDSVLLSEAEKQAISDAVAKARGGVAPKRIKEKVQMAGTILDDDDEYEDDDE